MEVFASAVTSRSQLNQVLLDKPYPLPDTEDIFATLGSGTVFSKIDLSNAYQQMELNPESQHYLTVNTHKGLYAYQRLTCFPKSSHRVNCIQSWRIYFRVISISCTFYCRYITIFLKQIVTKCISKNYKIKDNVLR